MKYIYESDTHIHKMQHLRAAVNIVHPITLESHIVKICATRSEALELAIFRMREEIRNSSLFGKVKLVHYLDKSPPWHETEAHRLREAIGTESRKYFMRGKSSEALSCRGGPADPPPGGHMNGLCPSILPCVYVVSWTGCEDNRLI